jgi:HK97 family phage major capsid protein
MTGIYDTSIDRDDAGAMPQRVVDEIVTAMEKESTALALGHRVPTTTKDSRIPVLSEAPEAYWVGGDDGLKQTGKAVWSNEPLMAEEIATIVPIPDAVVDDNEFDLWSALKPLLSRALSRRLDAAVLFGTLAPASWGLSLYEDALATGNVITEAAIDDDPVADVLQAAELVGADGYTPNGAVVRPAWQYTAAAVRTQALVANPAGANTPFPMLLAGLGIHTDPLYWERAKATALVADWRNVLIGVRRDITIEMFKEGVITDENGVVVLNLMQQDSQAARATMRVGYLLAKPVTDVDLDESERSPVALVQLSGGGS